MSELREQRSSCKSLDTNEKISKRFFLGCLITSELSMNLNQSIKWKHQKIMGDAPFKLFEVHYQGKDYLGVYLDLQKILVSELIDSKASVLEQIKELCPQVSSETLSFFVFSQLFIA